MVAIGRPNELLVAPGAERMYVRDSDWQATVLGYIRASCGIIVQPSGSDGVRWEVEKVFALGDIHKVLLSMVNFYGRSNDYEGFRDWFRGISGIALPACLPYLDQPCLIELDRNGTPHVQLVCYRPIYLWLLTGNAVDVRRTFSAFVQKISRRQS